MRLCDVGCGRPLCVAVLAIVETIFRADGNTEHCTKAIAGDIGAAAKWAWTWFYVGHVQSEHVQSERYGLQAVPSACIVPNKPLGREKGRAAASCQKWLTLQIPAYYKRVTLDDLKAP